MDQTGSSPSETFGRWKSQRRLHRKTTKAIGKLGSSQSSIAESVFDPAAEGEGEMTDDPNEAYEVVPIEPGPHGPPKGWWTTVKRNGLPVRHFPGK